MSIMAEVNPNGTTLGFDLAKNVFAVHGIDENGKAALFRPKVAPINDCRWSLSAKRWTSAAVRLRGSPLEGIVRRHAA